ncbi:hypothetical protein [Kitasatospora sp. MBT66]|uniref:hypothetical protein n=1 Tax=Kitasatospora sp. MBT66 TaxID=1444769 RepID=UPI0005B83A58|nr:hypothetical protein [Kitasatospora sp. MBT66]
MTGFDAVFLSFDEPLASVLHARSERVLGRPVKRLHGIRGMRRAYRLCAELPDAEAFFLADGDFEIDDRFAPGAVAPLDEGVAMRVWQAVNPVNGLTYGYGGLKLVRTAALKEMGEAVDVLAALPGKVEFAKIVAGTTRFDQSPFHAWRAGFRECAMLARGCEYGTAPADARFRIAAWTDRGDGPYGEWAILGAREGVSFAATGYRTEAAGFEVINDPSWLHGRFQHAHGAALPVGAR